MANAGVADGFKVPGINLKVDKYVKSDTDMITDVGIQVWIN